MLEKKRIIVLQSHMAIYSNCIKILQHLCLSIRGCIAKYADLQLRDSWENPGATVIRSLVRDTTGVKLGCLEVYGRAGPVGSSDRRS